MKDDELLKLYQANLEELKAKKQNELNRNNELGLKQSQLLDETYKTQQNQLEKAKTSAQQSANISNEKLLKYLGLKHQSSGLAKGQTGSDFIRANNNYVTTRAGIENDYADNQAALLNEYKKNKAENEQTMFNNEQAILDKYRTYQMQEEDRYMSKEDRERDIEKWNLEIDAYKKQLADAEAVKTAEKDEYWYNAAASRLSILLDAYKDEEGNISDTDLKTIQKEMDSYRNKFSDEEYFNRLLDYYTTQIYGN